MAKKLMKPDEYVALLAERGGEITDDIVVTGSLVLEDGAELEIYGLVEVRGDLSIAGAEIKTLGRLTCVTGELEIKDCRRLHSLGELRRANKVIIEDCPNLCDLGRLSIVEEICLISCPKIDGLGGISGTLKSLEVYDCHNFSSLGGVKTIKGDLKIESRKLTSLGNLEVVEGILDVDGFDEGTLGCPNLEDASKLIRVGRILSITCRKPVRLDKLRDIGSAMYVRHDAVMPSLIAKHKIAVAIDNVDVPSSLLFGALSKSEFREMDAEQRRVAIRRLGIKWLVDNSNAEIVDMDDHIFNGQRALLRVVDEDDDDSPRYCILVCGDPSTGRVYYMEVPSRTKTCQAADQYLNPGLDQRRQVGRT